MFASLPPVVLFVLFFLFCQIDGIEEDFMWGRPFIPGPDVCELNPEIKAEVKDYGIHLDKIKELVEDGRFKGQLYRDVALFADTFGYRLPGTPIFEKSMEKLYSALQDMSLYNVHSESVPIPSWQRGVEEAFMIAPRTKKIAIVGLVQSGSTPPEGITSEVVVIPSFHFAKQNKNLLKGKILIFDFQGGNKRNFRLKGGRFAHSYGGLAALGRSFVTFSLNTVTARTYLTPQYKIPIACISDEDVDLFVRLRNRGINVTLTLKLESTFTNETSRNVMADYIGRENGFPKEIVLLNSHVDTFGLSQGAQDNACGCILMLKVIELIQALAIRPRRTIRALFSVSGEVDYLGSRHYLQSHQSEMKTHSAVLIADAGCSTDMGFIFHQNFPLLGCLLHEISLLFEKTMTLTITGESFTSGDAFSTTGNLPVVIMNGDDGRFYWIRHTKADMMTHMDSKKLDDILIFWTATVLIISDMTRTLQDLGTPIVVPTPSLGNSTNSTEIPTPPNEPAHSNLSTPRPSSEKVTETFTDNGKQVTMGSARDAPEVNTTSIKNEANTSNSSQPNPSQTSSTIAKDDKGTSTTTTSLSPVSTTPSSTVASNVANSTENNSTVTKDAQGSTLAPMNITTVSPATSTSPTPTVSNDTERIPPTTP